MENLEQALRKFCEIFGRSDFDIGDVSYQEKLDPTLPTSLPSSKELVFLYSHISFKDHLIVGGDMILQLEAVEKLEGAQHGWRWILNNKKGLQQKPTWPESWVVIGNRNGDALIVDTSVEGSPIYGAIQSDHFKISDSLTAFFSVFADWMECEYVEFNMETEDDDFNPKPEFLARLRKIATNTLSADELDGFFKFFFE